MDDKCGVFTQEDISKHQICIRFSYNIFPTGFITVYITTLRFLSLNETGNQKIVKTQSLLYKHMHVQLFW